MIKIKEYASAIVYGILAIALIVTSYFVWSLSDDLEDMTNKRDNALLQAGISEANNITLSSVIKQQNEKIEALKVDRDNNLKELEIWKNKPAEIKYRPIYKELPKKTRAKEDISCEEIKNVSDSLDGFDLNSL